MSESQVKTGKPEFQLHIDALRGSAQELGDPAIPALLDTLQQRFEAKDVRAIGDEMLKRLERLGVPKDKRTQIRQILAAHGVAVAACW